MLAVAHSALPVGFVSPHFHLHATSMALDRSLGKRKALLAQQDPAGPVAAAAAASQPGTGQGDPMAIALQQRLASVVQSMPPPALLSLGVTPAQTAYTFSCYVNAPNVPHYIKQIPASELVDVPKLAHTLLTILSGKWSTLLDYLDTRDFDRWTTPQDYEKFFSARLPALLKRLGYMHLDSFTLPALHSTWTDNLVWGEQFLSGPNPTLIRKVKAAEAQQLLNDFFPLTAGFNVRDRENRVKQLVGRAGKGKLEYSAVLDRLYVVDHDMLLKCSPVRDLNDRDKAYVHAPKTLLFATPPTPGPDGTAEVRLAPLAIWVRKCVGGNAVLTPSKPTVERLFYPDSPAATWMFAKMCVGNADANHHELVAHLGFTHLLTEAVAISTIRTFSGQGFGASLAHDGHFNEDPAKDHPVYRLLLPHFHRTLLINEQGRHTLMNPVPGGLFSLDQVTSLGVNEGIALIDSSFEAMQWNTQVNMEENLASRGFPRSDPGQLSRFYYRDFGYKVWDALERYVELSLQRGFADAQPSQTDDSRDILIRDDRLLQAWCDCTRGPLNTLQGHIPSFPKTIDNFSQLVTLCTSIIWSASAQHAAVNFSQYDYVSDRHTPVPTRAMHFCLLASFTTSAHFEMFICAPSVLLP